MRNIISITIILFAVPFSACSQLSFWDDRVPELPGCALWTIQTTVCEPCISRIEYTDCRGNDRQQVVTSDGSSFQVCSMSRPVAFNNSPPLVGISSITQDGWCTDPIASDYRIYLDASDHVYDEFWRGGLGGASQIRVFSVEPDGTSPNLLGTWSKDFPQGLDFNDPHKTQTHFLIEITGGYIFTSGTLAVMVRAGRASANPPRLTFNGPPPMVRSTIFPKQTITLTAGRHRQ